MEKKNNTFKDFVAPILVLVVICFIVTFALAFTYGITKPIIDKNTAAAADKTRTELLSDADSFKKFDGKLVELEKGKVFVTDCYVADNGTGMVCTVKSNSYGGLLTAMIGIDKSGAVTAVKVTEAADTPGVGTKAQDAGHLKQYKGQTELTTDVKADPNVNAVSGATISSSAVHKAVACALMQFEKMGGIA
ncbi:MAG: FMN-binding protein [Clostridiales bacterium]|jgi:electron transport complex protein RnfG|nr:FMN-binding protein [Clostridiales bacterium]